MIQLFLSNRYKLAALAALAVFSVICIAMAGFWSLWQNGYVRITFLMWNLFLAWMPVWFALGFANARNKLMRVVLLGGWLVFLPNAPYILTDLIHVRGNGEFRYWYALVMVLAFAWTGFLLGYVSLYVVQKRLAQFFGHVFGWVFAFVSLALSSFGIYLGRVERFNSWDVLTQPYDLLFEIYQRVRYPFEHPRTYGMSMLFTVLLIGIYLTLYAFAFLPHERERQKT